MEWEVLSLLVALGFGVSMMKQFKLSLAVGWMGFLMATFFCSSLGYSQALSIDPSELRSPQTEKTVSVLQQRFFWKKWRPELGATVGAVLNDPYTDATIRGLRLGLFVTETIGIEVSHALLMSASSEDRKIIKRQKFRPKTPPETGEEDKTVYADVYVNDVQSVSDFNLVVAPFYGKMNLFDGLIVYTDLYLTGGIISLASQQGKLSGFLVGGGQKFNFKKSWSIRLDFRMRSYEQKRFFGGGETELKSESYRKNSFYLDTGVSYFFL